MAVGNYNAQWQKGAAFYQQSQYDSAAYYFEQIAALKPQNPEVYYNLGNTYYRLNKIAFAVLNYQRALQIKPDYKEAKDNLALTEARISNHIQPTNEIFFLEWWQSITHPIKTTIWSIAALFAFILIIVSLFSRRYGKAGHRIPVQVPGIFGFICVCFLILAFAAAKRAQASNQAVVMENDAPLMNSEQKGKPLSLVPEGTTVKILDEKARPGWVEVSLPDGRSGWLQANLIDKI
jgi:tetratricopeptide (TPR) repeat protein